MCRDISLSTIANADIAKIQLYYEKMCSPLNNVNNVSERVHILQL